jgi:hypothetical protein
LDCPDYVQAIRLSVGLPFRMDTEGEYEVGKKEQRT